MTEDPIDAEQYYLRDVHGFPLLTPEEEERLARRIEVGRRAAAPQAELDSSRQARDQLVLANLRLVVHIARGYKRFSRVHGLELLDLIQEGNLGLLQAAESFESGHAKFSTFAAPWIRGKIGRALAGRGQVIQVSLRTQAKLDRLRRKERLFLDEMGRPPTLEELATELEIDTESLVELRLAEQDVVSLNQRVPGQEDELILYADLVEDPQGAAFAQRAADRQWLDWLLGGLSERSRRILEWRYGLGLTLEEIGMRESVSRERIRQIESEALEKLRQ